MNNTMEQVLGLYHFWHQSMNHYWILGGGESICWRLVGRVAIQCHSIHPSKSSTFQQSTSFHVIFVRQPVLTYWTGGITVPWTQSELAMLWFDRSKINPVQNEEQQCILHHIPLPMSGIWRSEYSYHLNECCWQTGKLGQAKSPSRLFRLERKKNLRDEWLNLHSSPGDNIPFLIPLLFGITLCD